MCALWGPTSEEELLLGGSEYLCFGAAIEGELVPLFAHEYGAPGAPVLFGAENDQPLSTLFAHKDDLLRGRTLRLNTSFALSGNTVMVLQIVWHTQGATLHTGGTGTSSTRLYFNLLMLYARLTNRFNRT